MAKKKNGDYLADAMNIVCDLRKLGELPRGIEATVNVAEMFIGLDDGKYAFAKASSAKYMVEFEEMQKRILEKEAAK